jgi:hypothetical protein
MKLHPESPESLLPETEGEIAKSEYRTPSLPIGRYRLRFQSENPVVLSGFTGSAWRGALGHALREVACITRATSCAGCPISRSCAYSWVFETTVPPDSKKMRRYPNVPHPYILQAPPAEDGHDYRLGLTLAGRANQHLGIVIHALKRAGAGGVAGNILHLGVVEQLDINDAWTTIYSRDRPLKPLPISTPHIPAVPSGVRLDLTTPLRLRSEGKELRPGNFQFSVLFSNLLRRVSMLTYFHTDTPLETDFAGLSNLSKQIQAASVLHTQNQWRYSTRQQSKMDLAGLMGHVTIEGQNLAPFWPYLWLGQWVHAGHNTTMGLGQYRLTSL